MRRVILLFVLLMTVAIPAVVSADSGQATYLAVSNVYKNSNMTVYLQKDRMISMAGGSSCVIMKNLSNGDEEYSEHSDVKPQCRFMVRGTSVYLSETPIAALDGKQWPDLQKLYVVKADGTSKLILRGAGDLLGGYGSDLLTQRRDNGAVYRIANGQKQKLFTTKKQDKVIAGKFYTEAKLFSGKLYYDNKAYDLSTEKTRKFVASSIVVTKKYMYYVDKNKKLIRLSGNGTRRVLAAKVSGVLGGNDSGCAVYTAKNKKGKMTFYRTTAKGKTVTLISQKAFKKKTSSAGDVSAARLAVMASGKVFFATDGHIVSVPNQGGAAKIVGMGDNISSLEARGKKIYYTINVGGDFPMNYYITKKI